MSDLISRQTAIDVAKEELDNGTFYDIPSKIKYLPSAQPEPCEDTISRRMAIAEIARWIGYIDEDMILRIQIGLKKLPFAQPVIRCKDCKHFGGGTYCHEKDGIWEENDFCSYAERKEQDDG